jgi:hypothetical protein
MSQASATCAFDTPRRRAISPTRASTALSDAWV